MHGRFQWDFTYLYATFEYAQLGFLDDSKNNYNNCHFTFIRSIYLQLLWCKNEMYRNWSNCWCEQIKNPPSLNRVFNWFAPTVAATSCTESLDVYRGLYSTGANNYVQTHQFENVFLSCVSLVYLIEYTQGSGKNVIRSFTYQKLLYFKLKMLYYIWIVIYDMHN